MHTTKYTFPSTNVPKLILIASNIKKSCYKKYYKADRTLHDHFLTRYQSALNIQLWFRSQHLDFLNISLYDINLSLFCWFTARPLICLSTSAPHWFLPIVIGLSMPSFDLLREERLTLWMSKQKSFKLNIDITSGVLYFYSLLLAFLARYR